MPSKLVVKLAKGLVSRLSDRPEHGELETAEYIFSYLKDLGLNPRRQFVDREKKLYNIFVYGGKEADLLINGHMDVVPFTQKEWKYNPLGQISGGRLYGRGAADTKGNIACVLAAMKEQFNENIVYLFNTHEETTWKGISKAMKLRKTKLKNIKYSISLEPTGGKIAIGNRGQYLLEATAKGKSAHASSPQKGENAIYKIAGLVHKIEKRNKDLSKKTYPLFGNASISVRWIEGGRTTSSVPDRATIHVDRRVLPNEDPKAEARDFIAFFSDFDCRLLKLVDPCETPKNSKIVEEMQAALRKLKMNPALTGFTAASECSEMAFHGIQGIIYGQAKLRQAHRADEHITLKELEKGEKVFSELFRKWK